MITASEARELINPSLEHPKNLSILDKIQLKKIERHIRKAAKNGDYVINICLRSRRPRVERTLKEEGKFRLVYWRSQWNNGLRLMIFWNEKS